MISLLRQQPRPFFMIFLLEIWERFGFYTVQGILVLYFVRYLGLSEARAYQTFGAFSALIYSMVPLGGFLGDKILGTKRTIIIGLVVLALGYLALAFVDKEHVFWALGLICVGNGLFKANPSSLLAKCYQSTEPTALQTGFTLYYMAINIGAIAALFVGPIVSSRYGYFYAYILSFIGITLGLCNYWFQRQCIKNINVPADLYSIRLYQWCAVFLGMALLIIIAAYLLQYVYIAKILIYIVIATLVLVYFACIYQENDIKARRHLYVVFILMLEAVMFFTLYQQMPTSVNLFAVHNVRTTVMGLMLDPQSFQVLNPLWIIIMSPVMACFYSHLRRKGVSFPLPYKFALGMTCCALGFLVLFCSSFVHDKLGYVSPYWLVGSYFFQSLGELLVSALGVAMVAELVSPHIMGFVMGFWYLTSATAGFTGAAVASLAALPKANQSGTESLYVYTHTFATISLATFVVACGLWLVAPRLTRLMDIK